MDTRKIIAIYMYTEQEKEKNWWKIERGVCERKEWVRVYFGGGGRSMDKKKWMMWKNRTRQKR